MPLCSSRTVFIPYTEELSYYAASEGISTTIMSSLTFTEKTKLEKLFGMSSGYVSNFSDTTFGHFFADEVGVDIHCGSDIIKRLLSNLGTIGNGLAELRGLYGTGHGKHGKTSGLSARHAKLAVGAATPLATFLFDTHKETIPEAP